MKREWTFADVASTRELPPDLTTMYDWCPATWMDDEYGCTRPCGHSGRHAAGDGDYITAVWGDGVSTDIPICKSSGKKMYPTQRVAIRVLLSCSRKRGQALRVYFHKDCKSYHMSSKPKKGSASVA